MSRDPRLVDSDDIIRELCRFHTDTDEGARAYPTMHRYATDLLHANDFVGRGEAALRFRSNLVADACRLQRTATSTTQGDVAAVPYFDGREIIRWSDFHAGIMPEGTRQAT